MNRDREYFEKSLCVDEIVIELDHIKYGEGIRLISDFSNKMCREILDTKTLLVNSPTAIHMMNGAETSLLIKINELLKYKGIKFIIK